MLHTHHELLSVLLWNVHQLGQLLDRKLLKSLKNSKSIFPFFKNCNEIEKCNLATEIIKNRIVQVEMCMAEKNAKSSIDKTNGFSTSQSQNPCGQTFGLILWN